MTLADRAEKILEAIGHDKFERAEINYGPFEAELRIFVDEDRFVERTIFDISPSGDAQAISSLKFKLQQLRQAKGQR